MESQVLYSNWKKKKGQNENILMKTSHDNVNNMCKFKISLDCGPHMKIKKKCKTRGTYNIPINYWRVIVVLGTITQNLSLWWTMAIKSFHILVHYTVVSTYT